MKSLVMERTSAAKAGWVIGVLFVLWIGFVLLPDRPREPPPKPTPLPQPSLKLYEVGLPEDPDLMGLPGFFAVWADRAEWKDGKTRFAYRHPVTGEFSFYFEATKTSAGYRFREIPKPVDRAGHMEWTDDLGDDCPIRFYVREREPASRPRPSLDEPAPPLPQTENEKIPVVIPTSPAKLDVPLVGPELKPPSDDKKPNR